MNKHKKSKILLLEKIMKGVGNYWRIEILFLLYREENFSVFEIANFLHAHFKTISEHTRRLEQAGLIEKWSEGTNIRHRLTTRGKTMVKLLKTIS